jgi:transposase
MAMGTRRKRERQQDLWIATSDVVETPANAFYDRLNQILEDHKFDAKVERVSQKFYKKSPYGRPSMAPGVYVRSLLIGYFEGLDSERGIAWRTADSLSLHEQQIRSYIPRAGAWATELDGRGEGGRAEEDV